MTTASIRPWLRLKKKNWMESLNGSKYTVSRWQFQHYISDDICGLTGVWLRLHGGNDFWKKGGYRLWWLQSGMETREVKFATFQVLVWIKIGSTLWIEITWFLRRAAIHIPVLYLKKVTSYNSFLYLSFLVIHRWLYLCMLTDF